MKVGVLGTGMVGRSIAEGCTALEHEVVIGTRDVAETMARNETDFMGNPPYNTWSTDHPQIQLHTFADAAAHGEIVVNATNGGASLSVLNLAKSENLNGKPLIDIANPLDFSAGMPPNLFVKDTDSLGEQIQREFPEVKVVKTLNTMNALLMINPSMVGDGEHTVFMSGNDDDAKRTVSNLLHEFGWKDIIDLGDITGARGTEMLLPIWLRLMGTLGTPNFNFKIVR